MTTENPHLDLQYMLEAGEVIGVVGTASAVNLTMRVTLVAREIQ